MADLPTLEVTNRRGRCLRATFLLQRDRYAHRIEVLEHGRVTICLTTEEGDADDQWPPSPPLQQYSTEAGGAGESVVLLLGMAGKNHWSASVESDATTATLVFDVACRVARRPRWLGSTYCVEPPITLDSQGTPSVVVGDRRAKAIVEPADAACTTPVTQDGNRVMVAPSPPDAPPPFTVRWKYRIRLTG